MPTAMSCRRDSAGRRDPYGAEIEDGPHGPVMYGRGVAVSKSDFATYAFALLALKEAAAKGAKLGGTVELHFTYDEEAGGDIGPKMAARPGADQAGLRDRRGLLLCDRQRPQRLPAPRGHGDRQAGARRHAGERRRCARSGDRASWRRSMPAAPIARQERSPSPGISSPTLNVGLIKGGINTNVVPDQVTFRLDRRIIPEESPPEVEAALAQADCDRAQAVRRHQRGRCGGSCWRRRLCRSPGSERIAGGDPASRPVRCSARRRSA